MIIFLFIIVAVFSLIHGYVAHKFIPRLSGSSFTQVILWSILFVMAMSPLVPPILRAWNVENSAIDKLALIAYTSLGFFTLAFTYIAVLDIVILVGTIYKKLKQLLLTRFKNNKPIDTFNPDRRKFIFKSMQGGILLVSGLMTGYGFFNARRGPDIIRMTVPLKNCPEELSGLRILQISDIHVGPTIKKDYVEHIVQLSNGLKPDLAVITGDLVDGSVNYLSHDVEPLKGLYAPLGKFFCTGNHEYYAGVHHWLSKIDELGYRSLVNEHVEIATENGGKFILAGVNDISAHYRNPEHRTDPDLALKGAPENLLKILLAHQPGSIHDANRLGVDLQLSGHTHGGQFFPFSLGVGLAHPYSAGLHDHNGTKIYVNRGTGYWGPPLRIGMSSEITLLTITNMS